MGLNLSNHTYLITPKCQIMNSETKLIKTKLGLLQFAEKPGNDSEACKLFGTGKEIADKLPGKISKGQEGCFGVIKF